jgi:hypothetical protein
MASISSGSHNNIEAQVLESDSGGLEVDTGPRGRSAVEILSYVALVIYVGAAVAYLVFSAQSSADILFETGRLV